MIKIIKWGKKGKICICPNCDCEFTYEQEDIWYGTQIDPCKIVACPCCKHHIDLQEG